MESGSSHQILPKRMEERLVAVGDAKPKSAVSVTGNGMEQRIARKMKKRIDCSLRQRKLDGSDAIVVGLWLN